MYITIDRFEGDFAVVETESGEIYNMPRALVPDASEGDVVSVVIDKEKTSQNTDDVQHLINELFND